MADFNEREQGFEAKFAHDEALRFRIEARASKLLGLWAAELMGIPVGDAANNYARDLALADMQEVGKEDLFRILRNDLQAKGIDPKPLHLEKKLAEFLEVARQQLAQG
ncbi:MAG: DUF1476 domain-containing protein [Alphaproteobacteria bacterium]